MQVNNNQCIDFGDYPFFVGVRNSDGFQGVPASLPFTIRVDEYSSVPMLDVSEEISGALSHAYGQGSMLSTPLGIGRLGLHRMDEFIKNFISYIGDLTGKRIIEIGCGEGHLLAKLDELGADVIGLEIGPQGKQAEINYGIKVIDTTLDQASFDNKFDAIISYGCLEHILDINNFVKQCHSLLNESGVMFHSVPNTDNTFNNFRFDDLCHQHVNYFTPDNVRRLFKQNCFKEIQCNPSNAGNEMFMMARFADQKESNIIVSDSDIENTIKDWVKFSKHLNELKLNFKKNLSGYVKKARVGFYGGGHILTQMTGMGSLVEYFDSDTFKHGRSWLAGLPAIKSPHSLLDDPVSYLIIGPEHHMTSISKYLFYEVGIPESINIMRISELYKS